MERSVSHRKTKLSHDKNGKVNPKSKNLPALQSNKKFIEDELKKVPSLQHTPNHLGKATQNIKKKPQISQYMKNSLKDHT